MGKQYILNEVAYAHLTPSKRLHIALPHEENVMFEEKDSDVILTILNIFKNPATVDDVSTALLDTPYEVDDIASLVQRLFENNVIKEYKDITALDTTLTPKQLAKYDRQLRNYAVLPNFTINDAIKQQERLDAASILILGAGGIGSYLAIGLAQIGVGTLHLIDFDEIELSNTSRQVLYREKDVGKSKIEVAVKNLTEVAPDATVVGHNLEVTSVNSLTEELKSDQFDLIAVCADKPLGKLVYIVDEFSKLSGTPVLYGGPYADSKIFLGPSIIPGKTKSYSELVPSSYVDTSNPKVASINEYRETAIVDTDNALAAKMMEVEIIKYIGKLMDPSVVERQIVLDNWNWSFHDGQFSK